MHSGWPLRGLRLRVGDLMLAPMTEDDLASVVSALPPDLELDPHATRFEGLTDAEQRAVTVHQEYWRRLGTWTTQAWRLPFCVRHHGRLVAMQEVEGNDFPLLRTVDSSSWLVASARGHGLGKQMRRAVLTLAFEHLGAVAAVTSAWHDNHASLGVSKSLGYRLFSMKRGDRVVTRASA